ncbi:MAG TPA: hypothetical protein VFB82_03565 [Blastocatellia bacterium]|nr:hypothetical protein [Blastocatellia bacterium]
MVDDAQLLEAIRDSGITRIAIIDDAFDAPSVDRENAGRVLDFFEAEAFAALRNELGLTEETHQRALQALRESVYDAEGLDECIRALYNRFIKTPTDRFDPAGFFTQTRGPNLEYLRPILKLLTKCEPQLCIAYIGSSEDLSEVKENGTELIFIDFYLDPDRPQAGPALGAKQERTAKAAAVDRVKELIEDPAGQAPSVVLMSSHPVRLQADEFRAKLNIGSKRIFASRFAFIEKKQFSLLPDGELALGEEAANALLDIFQSFEFGRALHAGLNCWLKCAAEAVESVREEIERLELKDFAYLVRFRLAEEGQLLLEYLEWFFGECLLDRVGTAVDRAIDDHLRSINRPEAASRIEGIFDGPTAKIAELYHHVRIESSRTNRAKNYRLGDLYYQASEGKGKPPHSVLAVMTPDCDLIMRQGKRKAKRLLTVSGDLSDLVAPGASVSDFIIINKKYYNVTWKRKSLATMEFDEWPAPGTCNEKLQYIGALRPLYAQELQRNVLHDLGRVGVPVAPAIGMTAAIQLFVREEKVDEKSGGRSGEKVRLNGALTKGEVCYVVPGRSETNTRIIFPRHFVGKIIASLSQLDPKRLPDRAREDIEQLKRADAHKKLAKMSRGVCSEEVIEFGIFLTMKSKFKISDNGPWCWLVVSMNKQE